MANSDWQKQTFTLQWLRERQNAPFRRVFDWLRAIGAVPAEQGVLRWGHNQNYKTLNADAIPMGYLAMVACEWDSWGPSSPKQFLDAMELETAGHEARDLIVETLEALGRAIAEEEDTTTYRIHLPKAVGE